MAKNQIKKEEEAIALDVQLNKAEAYIEKNLKKILCGICAVVLIVGAAFGWNHYISGKDEKARQAIAGSQQAFAQQQYEQALNGDGTQTVGFLRIIDEYSGTKTANIAKLYAALCYAKTGKYDEAIKYFEDYSQKDDQMISPASLAALGNCYVQKGDNKKGTDLLIKAAQKADNDAISPICLLQAAEIYEAEGKNDEAVSLYKQIKDKYFRSPLATEMDKYIERATK